MHYPTAVLFFRLLVFSGAAYADPIQWPEMTNLPICAQTVCESCSYYCFDGSYLSRDINRGDRTCACNQFSAAASATSSVAPTGSSISQTNIAFATPVVNRFRRRQLASSTGSGPMTTIVAPTSLPIGSTPSPSTSMTSSTPTSSTSSAVSPSSSTGLTASTSMTSSTSNVGTSGGASPSSTRQTAPTSAPTTSPTSTSDTSGGASPSSPTQMAPTSMAGFTSIGDTSGGGPTAPTPAPTTSPIPIGDTSGGASPSSPTGPTTLTSNTASLTTVVPSPSPSGGGGGIKLSMSDKIALGIGLGLGLPGAIMAIWQMCLWMGGFDSS